MAKKLHIRGTISRSYSECGRYWDTIPKEARLDAEKSDLADPRVCKWCRVTYESRKR